ncbi:Protein PRY2 [Cytospora mali]|uniref:Protein PRY2 n=1 Tax=Cytospora mali TaxID=578113 RepID=A0A194WE71_CYTMA|nr:Protein PRY2 [Valsa mali]
MKSSSLFLLSGASLALASPVMDVVVETDVYYYTVTQEVTTVETVPAGAPAGPPHQMNFEATSTSSNSVAVVTVTAGATEAASTAETKATSSTVEEASTASPTDFAGTATYHHNIHRTNNSAPSMTYGDTYASYASQVAASCNFAHDLTPGGGGYGQNIAMYASTDADSMTEELAIAQAITQMWYNGEIGLYPSNAYGQANPDFSNFEGWGHYSQVVWVGSNQLGCAAQYCPAGTMEPSMGSWFSVCNYYPAGNVDNEYGDNVLAPGSDATVSVNVSV